MSFFVLIIKKNLKSNYKRKIKVVRFFHRNTQFSMFSYFTIFTAFHTAHFDTFWCTQIRAFSTDVCVRFSAYIFEMVFERRTQTEN